MSEDTNIQKILKELRIKKLSKSELTQKTRIHYYLIDKYLDALLKSKKIIEEKNESGKYSYYKLKWINLYQNKTRKENMKKPR